MTVKQIRAFLAVAQSLSFAVACERLHLSQSALSLTIKALEQGLGGRLFSRTTRNVALTPEGESLLPLARRSATKPTSSPTRMSCSNSGRSTPKLTVVKGSLPCGRSLRRTVFGSAALGRLRTTARV